MDIKFKDAPTGARFKIMGDVYVKIHDNDSGLIVAWNGNIKGRQSCCCWVDEANGYTLDTIITLI